MTRKTISVDFDDVVMDFNRCFMEFHNQKYGTSLSYDQLTRYEDWEISYGNDKSTMTDRAKEFYLSLEHGLAAPVAGALEAITDLSKDYSLHIVTSRPEHVREATISWISKHLPNVFTDFHFTNIYAADEGVKARSKAEVCHEIGAGLLIDDALRHAQNVAEAGIMAIIPDRPWNQGDTPTGTIRMHSWPEITSWIKSNI